MSGLAAYKKVINVKTTASTAYTALPGNSGSLNLSRAQLDDTDFSTTGWMSRVAGLKDYSLSVSNIYGSTNAGIAIIRSAILTGVSLDFQYLPNGVAGLVGRVQVESFNLSGDVAGLETADCTLPSDGTALSTV